MKVPATIVAALLLAGCAAPQPSQRAKNGTEKKFGDAVVAPLADLNLIRDPIPPVLAAAQKGAYAAPPDASCATLASEVDALDAVLGDDVDAHAATGDPTMMERGSEVASDAVIGAVRSTTEGVIPFRGWVRKLTGAERYAREVAAAVNAGTIRRAYLKGLGQAAGCPAPAAPRLPADSPRGATSRTPAVGLR